MVSGKGIDNLIKNGVNVRYGICQELVKKQNRTFFFKNINKRPFITVKIASSIDGKSHLLDGLRTYITCEESRADVQNIRALNDAILTGGNTLINDNPKMNARVSFPVNQPKKYLLSSKTNFDFYIRIF